VSLHVGVRFSSLLDLALDAVPILSLLCPYPDNCQVDLTIGPIPGGLLRDSPMHWTYYSASLYLVLYLTS
jgi:hypothetical protein